jgi:hypothetical protein
MTQDNTPLAVAGRLRAVLELAKKATSIWQQSMFVDSHRYDKMTPTWKRDRAAEEALILRGPGEVGTSGCNPVANFAHDYDLKLACALRNATSDILHAVELLEEAERERGTKTEPRG